ncbi:MAG: cysteine--tRNA ligase [Patescibacteria group bacterium]|nr:cysteine--tRNA ligase [Patescibacteria group bacterium]
MKLFDTPTQKYVDFTPGPVVGIYTCGITPYDSAHLGHIFTFQTYDLLQRRLEDKGHEVRLVRNITDVDEPIYKKAAELGISYIELAEQETALFQSVLTQLDFRPTYAEPRASHYIDQMAAAVTQLVAGGQAYRLDDDIYFDTTQDVSFGDFCGFSDRLQRAFMQKRGGDPSRAGKRHPLDFLLWRGVSNQQDLAAWDTALGRGRPGWHIECSVMAGELLGTPFDLHGGGDDLIFPHHECEIAQSTALGQPQLAKTWLHVAPILYAGEKMSKSLGNLVFAKDLLQDHAAAVIRLSLMKYHYRTGGEWQPEFLDEATALLQKVSAAEATCTLAASALLLSEVRAALDDDLDTHRIWHALEDFGATAAGDPATEQAAGNLTIVKNLLGFSN